jgi:hypothetical protein
VLSYRLCKVDDGTQYALLGTGTSLLVIDEFRLDDAEYEQTNFRHVAKLADTCIIFFQLYYNFLSMGSLKKRNYSRL